MNSLQTTTAVAGANMNEVSEPAATTCPKLKPTEAEMTIPTFFRISDKILNSDNSVTLIRNEPTILSLPIEILSAITSSANLNVCDRVCLALSCKHLAKIVVNNSSLLKHPVITHELEHEELEARERRLVNTGFSDDDDMYQEEEQAITNLEEEQSKRFPNAFIVAFFRRLDQGWNQSESRFCEACGKFVSVTKAFWDQKALWYQYKYSGYAALGWRRGDYEYFDETEYGADAKAYIKEWMSAGKRTKHEDWEVRDMICPNCKAMEWYYECRNCIHY